MELFADRFLRATSSVGLDLASGERVEFHESAAGDTAEQVRWAGRCAALSRIRRLGRPRLIDFGVCGGGRRFETYAMPAAEAGGQAAGTGRPVRAGTSTRRPSPIVRIRLQPRRALAELLAIADDPGWISGRVRVVALRGGAGAGRTTLLEQLAREARLRGYVPVRASFLRAPAGDAGAQDVLRARGGAETVAGLLAGRHLLVIDDSEDSEDRRDSETCGRDLARLARVVVSLGIAGTRDHLVVTTHQVRAPCAVVDMDRLSASELGSIVRLHRRYRSQADRMMSEAARFAEGAPGLFLDRLYGLLCGAKRTAGCRALVMSGASAPTDLAAVAEDAAAYDAAAGGGTGPPSGPSGGAAGRAGANDAARRTARRRAAEDLAQQIGSGRGGRHAARERRLRSLLGAAARRREWTRAGVAGVWLGRLLLDRGRATDAAAAFLMARERFDLADDAAGCVVAGTWAGLAWTDEGRLREAEAVLAASRIGARQAAAQGSGIHERAERALARCLFWQGRYDEARLALGEVPQDDAGTTNPGAWAAWAAEPDARVMREALAARIALGEGRLEQAAGHALAAERRATTTGGARTQALALMTRGLVSLKVSDLDTVRRIVPPGLAAAREAGAPLLALRLRILAALGAALAGDRHETHRLRRHLQRAASRPLPSLLRARVLQAWLRHEPTPSSSAIARRLIGELDAFRRDSGAEALQLFETARPGGVSAATAPAVVQAMIDLLGICQDAADERAALSRAAGFLKERLRASTVAVHIVREGSLVPAVWLGGGRSIEADTAQRALDLDQPVPPAASRSGREAAVPVRCGDRRVGVLACRWSAGTEVDAEAAVGLLAAAGAAVALHVRCLAEAAGATAAAASGDGDLIGTSEAMQALRRAIDQAAPTPFSVLIEGESGAGKELVARAIHRRGPRRDRPFCSLNCAALPDELFEAELFGHARGAFTGAAAERPGLFEEADGGTLFMDEVGELSPRAQAKLLRVLQEGEVRRLGEAHARRIDVRVVAATNRALREESAAGRFRRDLLYRLDVIRIVVPPLRERLDNLPALATVFWQRASGRIGSRAVLAPETLATLARYDWPGNVRELQNVMTTLAVTGPRRGVVHPGRLPDSLGPPRPTEWRTLEDARRAFEARFVRMVLARAGGHRGRAAAELGLTRQGLAKLITRLGLEPAGLRAADGGDG